MKQKFIEWFTKVNNGCAPSINADGSFEHEKTQHMFEAYQAGMAESDRKVEQLAAENSALLKFCKDASFDADYEAELGMERGGFTDALNDIKTPATDAILAEVRAQGVERLANAWYAIANETDPGISISDSSRLKYRQRADDAADFANEIRQEAAQ
ncbi:hypothetical protein Q5384_14515 [Enterobacter ludwigii]|uniref:hypothetical protein n=1 Tax=Enterobacter ludwigii TaxID=299767 RepID=UPI002B4BE2D4|nr:hypothetical protein [Enterobacter ludwigii]WRM03045.1 hypothetical protein Q5384_14515 [Enterobacter ludwigii]